MTFNYTSDMHDYLAKHYPLLMPKDLAVAFNQHFSTDKTPSQLCGYMKRKGIHSGRSGRFSKGSKPWNTGLKGVTTGGITSQFKKGHQPHNHVPIGTERISTDGYRKVKVAEPNVWEFVHRRLWEQHVGPIPHNSNVIILCDSKTQFTIDDLRLVTNAELARCNMVYRVSNFPEEVRDSLVLLSRLDSRLKDVMDM